MSLRLYIFIVGWIFLLRPVSAQSRYYSLADDRSAPVIESWNLTDPDTIGQSVITLHYEMRYVVDTLSHSVHQNRVIVQTDGNVVKYYVMRRHLQDRIMTQVEKLLDGTAAVPGVGGQYVKTAEEEEMDRIAGVDDILNSEIWFCRDKGILIERMHDYDRQNFAIEYEEPIPKFEWIIGSQQREIFGYQCFSAHAWFRGRSWTAWFCPEIPVDTGPWKFNGLPGVILAVTDSSSHYDWECVAVKGQEPIIYYRVPKKRIGKEQYAQYMKNIHTSPLSVLGHGGDVVFYSRASKKWLDDTWEVPYNPIELE